MASVVDRDLGWRDIKLQIRLAKRSYTKIGIQQESNLGDRELGEMATIGAVHEFGSPRRRVPARSFMRTSFDEQLNEINNLKRSLHSAVLQRRITVRQALAILGEFMTSKVKKKIDDIKYPPLKNPSERRSGGGTPNPLVDTGQLINSITHTEVING